MSFFSPQAVEVGIATELVFVGDPSRCRGGPDNLPAAPLQANSGFQAGV
ncbi:MAG: hypothetical protein K8S55_03665 [Phycisphaerae bacterium]|nr:hypothetical protein [Phycisphaerae bacterium]